MPERRIKAIIFDMDGVLVDAADWHYEALNRALNMFGYSISRYEHLVTYNGLPTRRKLEMLSLERGLPARLHGFLNDLKQQYTMELVHARCKPVFLQEHAIAMLKADGFKLGVASNSIQSTVETMMRMTHLSGYFDVQLSNEDVTRPKPDPEIYLVAARRLGVSPQECLVVEDQEHGIKAAQASGARVMVVRGVEDVTYDNVRRTIAQQEQGT